MPTHKFRLTPPPSTNNIWRRGKKGTYLAPHYRTWIDTHRPQVESVFGESTNPLSLARLEILVSGGTGLRRGRDLDNLAKAICDLLVRCCVITDDCYDVVQEISLKYLGGYRGDTPAFVDVFVHELEEKNRKV
jgi:Holliday junction resolvase RusA-like endonuclease